MTTSGRALTFAVLVALGAAAWLLRERWSDRPSEAPPRAATDSPAGLARPPHLAAGGGAVRSMAKIASPVVVPLGQPPLSEIAPLRVRFLARGTRTGLPLAAWEIAPPPSAPEGPGSQGGYSDEEGFATLPPLAVLWWASRPMRVAYEHDVPRPVLPTEGLLEIEVALAGRVVRLEGTLADSTGRPVPGGGVYSQTGRNEPLYGTVADGRGRFILEIPAVEGEPRAGDDESAKTNMYAVAPGFGLASRVMPLEDATEVEIRLEPEDRQGSLELTLLHGDGSPAYGAHAWVWPEGEPVGRDRPFEKIGHGEDLGRLRRDLMRRLVGGAAVDSQGYDPILGAALVIDLLPDASGVVRIAALPAGAYRLLAVAGLARDGAPVPPDRKVDDGGEEYEDGHGVSAPETLDERILVASPPAATVKTLRFSTSRVATGRIAVDQRKDWTDGAEHFRHLVTLADWPWVNSQVESGHWEFASKKHEFTGAFRLTGLPREACRLYVITEGYRHVEVEVPAAGAGPDVMDLGVLHVPPARLLSGTVTWEDGTKVARALVNVEGTRANEGARGVYDGAFYGLLLDEPLRGTEVLRFEVGVPPARIVRVPLVAREEDGRLRVDARLPGGPQPHGGGAMEGN